MLLTCLLSACATPAEAPAMAPERIASCPAAERLQGQIALGTVGGGSETRGWDKSKVGTGELKEAVRLTLDRQGFLAGDAARYDLDVFLVELNQPATGYTTEVVSFVRYQLTESNGGAVAYDDVETAAYTLGVNDVFNGVKRLKLASEGSVRQNISQFVTKLCDSELGR